MSSDSCRFWCRILIRALFGLNVLVVACIAFHREKNKTDHKSNREELHVGPSRSYHPLKWGCMAYACLFVCALENN